MKFIDDSGLLYLWQKIKNLLLSKVDKVDGKGLSTNDYTNADQAKVAIIKTGGDTEKFLSEDGTYKAAGGTIKDVKVNGTSVVTGSTANIDLSDYATEDYVDTAEQALIERIDALENMGSWVGTFDTKALVPNNKSSFPNGITINDYVNVRADESKSNHTTRYIASAINSTTGVITWEYDITYSTDVSGKMDKVAGAITDNIATYSISGQIKDSGKKLSEYWSKAELVAITNEEIDDILET